MQHALPHLPTQRVTAIAAAIAIGGGLGAFAIVNGADGDAGNASAPTVSATHEPTGGDSPTPYGGTRPGLNAPTAGHSPQRFGGPRR